VLVFNISYLYKKFGLVNKQGYAADPFLAFGSSAFGHDGMVLLLTELNHRAQPKIVE
jgi:hypothetical protein